MSEPTIAPKWTPGPWSYWHDNCARCAKEGAKEFCIDGPPGGYHGQFSNEADARLIVAAPELYEALQAFVTAGDGHDDFCDQWLAARAALAKARGEAT